MIPENPKWGCAPDAEIRGVGNSLGGERDLYLEGCKKAISPLEDINHLEYSRESKKSRPGFGIRADPVCL